MSILQEYVQHYNYIDKKKMAAIQEYIQLENANGDYNIRYDSVVYQKAEWQKFEKWYKIRYNNRHGRGPKRN